jgi:hypothetical protein
MRVIAFIEDPDVIKKILKHLGLWDVKRKPQPVANVYPPVIRYLNLICRKLDKNCRYIKTAQYVGIHPKVAHNIQFYLIPLPKREFLSIINSFP